MGLVCVEEKNTLKINLNIDLVMDLHVLILLRIWWNI